MAEFGKVHHQFWHDPAMRALTERGRMLALYLLTCPHRNLEGLYKLPLLYISADLGWDIQTVTETVTETVDSGFIEYDAEAEIVFICKGLKYQSPDNPNMVKAALRDLAQLPDSPLLERFNAAAQRYSERLAEGLPERFHRGFREGLGEQTETETETDPEAEADFQPTPPVTQNRGREDRGAGSEATPTAVATRAILAMGVVNPPAPNAGQLRAVERALARGHHPDAIIDLGHQATSDTIRHPLGWLTKAIERLANTDPQPERKTPTDYDRRPKVPDFEPDDTDMDHDAADTGLAAARARLEDREPA